MLATPSLAYDLPLLVDQRIDVADHIVTAAGGDEPRLAVIGQALAFLAVGLARRRERFAA
jgi:hypothetical protein